MITIVVAILGLLAVLWVLAGVVWFDDLMAETIVGKMLGTFVLGLLGLLCVALVEMGVGGLSYWLNDSGKRVTQSWSLQQIAHDQGLHGQFYLGSGTIDSEQEFVAYYKDGDGYRLGQFPADKTLVIEKDTTAPTLYEYDRYVSQWLIPNLAGVYHYRFVIVVPKGSIAPAVNLNLSGGAS